MFVRMIPLSLTAFAFLIATPLLATDPAKPPANTEYLDIVRRAADALLENARDNIGTRHSGMIMSVLDPKTAKPVPKLGTPPSGVREVDRAVAYGSNANLQQDLYRALQHLSRLTGEPRYDRAAREAFLDFLRITQHPDTGLLAWGEHLCWDCMVEKANSQTKTLIHEPKRKFLFFDLCYAAEPERTLKYAKGLWDHQIGDQKTGDFNRHAKYDHHGPNVGADFPKEGSYFIDTWSRAYEKTKDPVYRTAINTLAGRYAGRTNERGLLDHEGGNLHQRPNQCTCLWVLSLAREYHDAAARMDGETAELLRKMEAKYDKGFLALPHVPDDRERGFVCYTFTDSGKLRPWPEKKTQGYSRHWGLNYGINTTSMFALLSHTKQAQLGATETGNAYRKLVLQAADLYRSVPPPSETDDLWAGEYGMAIFTELAAFRLSHDRAYLESAEKIAKHAIDVLWTKGAVLPRASSKTLDYDVISYPDTLLLSLLALHEHVNGLEPRVEVSDLNR